MRLGAHVSISGAIHLAVDRASALGCESLQIFVGNPRQWRPVRYPREDVFEFRRKHGAGGGAPLVAHASYLVNLASPDSAMRGASVASLVHSMVGVEALGGFGVVTHVGSRVGEPVNEALERVALSLQEALASTAGTLILLENSAGTTLGSTFDELLAILDLVGGDPRVGFCLDTAHLFAAGWDLRKPSGVARVLDEFERRIGLARLRLVHLNDSRSPLGSRLDRHENIGEGEIGLPGFRAWLRDPRLAGIPGVLETPGFDRKGPDLRNLQILKRLRDGTRAQRPRRSVGEKVRGAPAIPPGEGPGSTRNRARGGRGCSDR